MPLERSGTRSEALWLVYYRARVVAISEIHAQCSGSRSIAFHPPELA
jgi:hypothetical protein